MTSGGGVVVSSTMPSMGVAADRLQDDPSGGYEQLSDLPASASVSDQPPISHSQHPKGKAAVGGQTHSHRPVSAMPNVRTERTEDATSTAAKNGAVSSRGTTNHGASAANAFANIVNNQPYNDRRASAHPVMTNPTPSSQVAGAPVGATAAGRASAVPAAIASAAGIDTSTASAIISNGIPITSPAALQYFAAHPRRQQVHFGNYLLLQTLGEGEFGKVKLGVHKEWGEEVAVKLIKRDRVVGNGSAGDQSGKDPSKMSKVEREIQVLKEVRHPNIVRLYEVIESDRYIGIVLEYASGGELFDHILAHKYLREKDACRLFAQLISGVHYLHQKRIIHRDLKLENLLLDRNRNVIITDFGFANNFGDKRNDLMATSCGSPCYAAPELVVQDGLYAGSAVDVWSCGVILYAMLAGYLPFDDDPANPDGDNINLLYKYIMATPLSFPDYITAEPRDLLSRMLVPDPTKRADLQDVMNHSWLATYRDLFKFSVEDLERAAVEQQVKKRQVYRQQMMLQHQIQEQQKGSPRMTNDATASGAAKSTTTRADGSKVQRHQSAMATPIGNNTSAGSPAAASRTRVSSNAQPTTTAPSPSFDPVAAQGDARGEPRSRISLEGDHAALSPSHQVNIPASTDPKRKPAAQKTQRHTIQLEYTGDQQQQKKREQQPAVPAMPASPASNARSPSGSAVAPTTVVVPALEAAVQAAISPPRPVGASTSSPARSTKMDQDAAATPTKTLDVTPQPASSPIKETLAAPKKRPATATPMSTNLPFPDSSVERHNSRAASDNVRRGSKMSTTGNGPPQAASSGTGVDPSGLSARHRKGLSRDGSFFSRLLSSPNGAPSGPTDGLPSTDGGRKVSAAESVGSNGKSSGRRKAMSLVVGRFGDSNSAANKDRQAAAAAANGADAKMERRLTGRLRNKEQSVPEKAVREETAVPSTPSQSGFRQSITPHPRPQRNETGNSTGAEGTTPNAAKKVMDWFRKKSLAKGDFDEQPPLPPLERLDLGPKETLVEEETEPKVVVTPSAPTTSNGTPHTRQESSGPSSRSTSGTHSYASHDTQVTGDSHATSVTTATQISSGSRAAVKSNASTLAAPETPRAGVNGLGIATADGGSSSSVFDEALLRHHVGAVDQSALTSLPPPEVFSRVREALTSMGVDFRLATGEDFKLECLRPKKGVRGLGGIGSTIRQSVFPPTQAEIERSIKIPSSPMSPSMSSGGSIRNFLRRGSSQQNVPQSPTTVSALNNASAGGAYPPTLYGEASVDGGQEVRFSVEITKIKNLPGLYSLDIRRMRGNVWAYKFCYTALLQRCNLSGQGIAL